jgi:hypothetical protein
METNSSALRNSFARRFKLNESKLRLASWKTSAFVVPIFLGPDKFFGIHEDGRSFSHLYSEDWFDKDRNKEEAFLDNVRTSIDKFLSEVADVCNNRALEIRKEQEQEEELEEDGL